MARMLCEVCVGMFMDVQNVKAWQAGNRWSREPLDVSDRFKRARILDLFATADDDGTDLLIRDGSGWALPVFAVTMFKGSALCAQHREKP